MSFMKKLFGGSGGSGGSSSSGPSKVSATTANKTITTIGMLKEQEENLEKRKSLLEKRVEDELRKAREFTKAGKKPQALMVRGAPCTPSLSPLSAQLRPYWSPVMLCYEFAVSKEEEAPGAGRREHGQYAYARHRAAQRP